MPPDLLLYQTGQVYVTFAAAQAYARHCDLQLEQARRELTEYLHEATRVGTEDQPELWRRRSRTEALDVSARVSREGRLAVVVSVSVRDYR